MKFSGDVIKKNYCYQNSMPIISHDDAIYEGDRLARMMANTFRREMTHRKINYNFNSLKWKYGKLQIVIQQSNDAFMIHGQVLRSARQIYNWRNNYFTFHAVNARLVGFDCEIKTTEDLEAVRRELRKLFSIQIYRERESELGR